MNVTPLSRSRERVRGGVRETVADNTTSFYVLAGPTINYSNVLPGQVTDYTDLQVPPSFFDDTSSTALGMHTRRGLTP